MSRPLLVEENGMLEKLEGYTLRVSPELITRLEPTDPTDFTGIGATGDCIRVTFFYASCDAQGILLCDKDMAVVSHHYVRQIACTASICIVLPAKILSDRQLRNANK